MSENTNKFFGRLKYGKHQFRNGTESYARPHINPDGTTGGWVAETAVVDNTCYVSPDAEVSEFAQVRDNAELLYEASVSGFATIKDFARVHDWSTVTDAATVCGTAEVCGGSIIGGESYLECGIVDRDEIYTGLIKKNDEF